MGNSLTRILTRPDTHPNVIVYYKARLADVGEALTISQAKFLERVKVTEQLVAALEEHVAKDADFRRTILEMLVSARSLKKRVQRLEGAMEKARRRKVKSKMGDPKRVGVKFLAELEAAGSARKRIGRRTSM